MADDCLFCKIVAGDIPADAASTRTSTRYAFADTNPQAPTHVLVVPRAHFTDVADLARDPQAAAGLLAGDPRLRRRRRG